MGLHTYQIPATVMSSSIIKLSYRRLEKLPTSSSEDQDPQQPVAVRIKGSGRWWVKLAGGRGRRWRRPRIRVAGLRRRLRRRTRLLGALVAKVVQRLKEGRPLMGELFAGNYMFMQVAPSPTMGHLEKAFLPTQFHQQQKQQQKAITSLPSPRFNYLPKFSA